MSTVHQRTDNHFHYEGFAAPNGTFVPDDVFDVLAPRLSEAELRVLLYIIRRTFGFNKHADMISLGQLTEGITTRDGRILDQGTGMSRKGVIGGIKGLLAKGIITVGRGVNGDGQHEINTYSLRFRDGVVTGGNYHSNRGTLPLVTSGTLQESALQESVIQQQVPGREPQRTGEAAPVVVNSDHTYGRPDLYEALKDLGVHHHTASKLLREQEQGFVEQICDYVRQRLEQGWTPQESVAGWVVTAVRQRFVLPETFRSREDQARETQDAQVEHERVLEAARREEVRHQEEMQEQRRRRLEQLGIEQNVDKIWQDVQARLRETEEWSLAMALCFLKHIEGGLAVLLVPAKGRGRLEGKVAEIELALREVSGQRVQLVLQDLPERGGW